MGFNGVIGNGGIVRFGPSDVVDSVGGVVCDDFGDWESGVRGEFETTVTEDAEVLGGGNGYGVFVEWAELDGVTVERGFQNQHGFENQSLVRRKSEC